MNFQESIQQCFQKYADFNGRAKRPEYWWFELFAFLTSLVLGAVSEGMSIAFSLAILIPSLAVGSRRLHDTNRSGWFQLLWFVPVLGWIALIYFLVQEGDTDTNQYGETPAN
jgi:uncharacterized membrane protein YhaH (DUF805 family)